MAFSIGQTFPAKLLLFGEYTVLEGGQALAIPLKQFSGKLVYDERLHAEQAKYWTAYLGHLDTLSEVGPEFMGARTHMASAMEKGIAFVSDIPVGYGLGSSGSLVAAIQAAFFPDESRLEPLQKRLALLEQFFHGKSSGMDPLVSYTGRAILKTDGRYQQLDSMPPFPEDVQIFLLNSGEGRNTQSLVKLFAEHLKDPDFRMHAVRPLILHADHAIHWLLLGEADRAWEHIRAISQLQWSDFQPMIHPAVRQLWAGSLRNERMILKLCGAGGGGFYLGFYRGDEMQLKAALQGVEFEILDVLS